MPGQRHAGGEVGGAHRFLRHDADEQRPQPVEQAVLDKPVLHEGGQGSAGVDHGDSFSSHMSRTWPEITIGRMGREENVNINRAIMLWRSHWLPQRA
jgi:hypothetical protein